MRNTGFSGGLLTVLLAATLLLGGPVPVEACTRALYVAKDGTVIVGRSMDWGEDMMSNMWVLPRGMKRDGRGGKTYSGNAVSQFVDAKLFTFQDLTDVAPAK